MRLIKITALMTHKECVDVLKSTLELWKQSRVYIVEYKGKKAPQNYRVMRTISDRDMAPVYHYERSGVGKLACNVAEYHEYLYAWGHQKDDAGILEEIDLRNRGSHKAEEWVLV